MDPSLAEPLEVLGKLIEILGIFLTSGELLSIRPIRILRILLSALVNGCRAKKAARTMSFLLDNHDERTQPVIQSQAMRALRGLSFIVFGILLQAFPYVVNMGLEIYHRLPPLLYMAL